jgi:hypothetical protein
LSFFDERQFQFCTKNHLINRLKPDESGKFGMRARGPNSTAQSRFQPPGFPVFRRIIFWTADNDIPSDII